MTTTPITLRLDFPLGSYQAHDQTGHPEWPPHPARMAAAILAGAHRHRRHIDLAEHLFTWPAPTLWAAPAAARDTDWRRYVPVDPAVRHDARPGTSPLEATDINQRTLEKAPERGTWVGDGHVLVHYQPGTPVDTDQLRDLLATVTYLGRPTSPVMVSLADNFTIPGHGDLYLPDPAGATTLRTADPDLLDDLNYAHELQHDNPGGDSPDPGFKPFQPHYPETRYHHQRLDPPSLTHQPAPRRLIDTITATSTWHATPGARPADVGALLDLLPAGHTVVPSYGSLSREGVMVERLFGVLIHPGWDHGLYAPHISSVDLRPVPVAGRGPLQSKIGDVWGTAAAWTSLTPVPIDGIEQHLEELAEAHQTQILDVQVHSEPRPAHAPDTHHHPRHTHVTVLFAHHITGPLTLVSHTLTPVTSTN